MGEQIDEILLKHGSTGKRQVWFQRNEVVRIAEDCLATQPQAPQGAETQLVLIEVGAERQRQDEKWGGAFHDDELGVADFVQLIEDYAGWARAMSGMYSYDKARRRLVQVAALAVACCESLDRINPAPEIPKEQS